MRWNIILERLHFAFVVSLRRGIDVVRNKIKLFAQTKVTLPPGKHKVVILDEADRYVVSPVSSVTCIGFALTSGPNRLGGCTR